jgi:hypothetical protein
MNLHITYSQFATLLQMTTSQIGKLGELLVQFRLLEIGIESAHLTTDSGIDLVAYSPSRKEVTTIQVKTNFKPKPGGGKGKPALDWWIPENSPAKAYALVDVSERRIWIFSREEIQTRAQQKSKGGFHLYMYTGTDVKRRKNVSAAQVNEFEEFLLEKHASSLFSINL